MMKTRIVGGLHRLRYRIFLLLCISTCTVVSCTKRTGQPVTAEQLQIAEDGRRRADSLYQLTQQRLDEVMAAVVSAEAIEGIMQQPGVERNDSPMQYRQRVDVLMRMLHERRQQVAATGVALEDSRKNGDDVLRLKTELDQAVALRDSLRQTSDLNERKLRFANERLIEVRKSFDSLKTIMVKVVKKEGVSKKTTVPK